MTDEDDKEATRIIARPGPKHVPFRVEPAVVAAAPESPRAESRDEPKLEVRAEVRSVPARPAVIVPPVGRPAVMVPPGGPARAGRSPLVTPPVVALPGAAATPPTPIQPVAPAAAVTPPPVVAAPAPAAPIVHAAIDPVVGWVVVVKGPGRGAALALHAGRNSLGAAPGEDLRLAFGDPAIAPSGHAFLAYDEEARAFFIEDGKKKELVRVNGRMLTETRPLAAGDEIRVGATTLRFVAFCGPDFDWAQPDAPVSPSAEAPNGAGEGI